MDYRTFELAGPTVDSWHLVRPLASYGENVAVQKSALFTLGGELRVWQLPGQNRTFSIPLRFVDSAFQAVATSWWSSRATLILAINRQVNSAMSASGVLGNLAEPFALGEPGRPDLWRGSLQFQCNVGSLSSALPFIMDDAVYGLMDQTYNPMLP